MKDTVRFIIITVAPQPVASEIDRARRAVCAVGQSNAALAYPPHVTLRTGVRVPVDIVSAFLDEVGTVDDDLCEEGFLAIRTWLERTPGAIPVGFEWTCDNVGVFRREGDTWSAYKLWRQ
jgi:hypothetical protein